MPLTLSLCPKCGTAIIETPGISVDTLIALHKKTCGGTARRVARVSRKDPDPVKAEAEKAERPPLEGPQFVNEVAQEAAKKLINAAVKHVFSPSKRGGRR